LYLLYWTIINLDLEHLSVVSLRILQHSLNLSAHRQDFRSLHNGTHTRTTIDRRQAGWVKAAASQRSAIDSREDKRD
jgi:hypothetical protein